MTEGARERNQGAGGSSRRAVSRLAWSIWSSCVALLISAWLLKLVASAPRLGWASFFDVLFNVLSLTLPTVGALVASHRPRNPIGWLFCFASLVLSIQAFTDAYATYSLSAYPAELPLVETMAWISEWIAFPVVLSVAALLFLHFPEGVLLSRRWRVVVWIVAIGGLLAAFGDAFEPGSLDIQSSVTNPFGVEGVLPMYRISTIGMWLLLGSCLVAATSLILRFRRGGGIERQQIKWFALAAFVMAFGFFDAFIAGFWVPWEWINSVAYFAGIFGFLMLPVATGIAILRYRLFDIDLIINRTLVYGTLTATLAMVYFGGVTLTQTLLRTLTSQEQLPQLVVVASTLVVAALFNPLRSHIQSFIDRRFYRRKYDARKTLETFSAQLRDETDLEALSADLVGVVRETMQPAHVSLWLRRETAKAGEQTD